MLLNEIYRVGFKYEKIMNERLVDYELTYKQWEVLRELYLSEVKAVNATIISKVLLHDKRTTSLILQKLEKRNYIIRIELPSDKRGKFIAISDHGLSICEEIIEIESSIEFFCSEIIEIVKLEEKIRDLRSIL